MTEEQGARRLERFADDLPRAAEAGLVEALKAAKERAVWWSSGPLTAADLRRMGHPYAARRMRQGGPDPGLINVGKTKSVVEGWTPGPVEQQGGTVRATLYNTSPHAKYLYDTSDAPKHPDRGTATMIGRPLPERVLAELEQRGGALAAVEAAIGEVMR